MNSAHCNFMEVERFQKLILCPPKKAQYDMKHFLMSADDKNDTEFPVFSEHRESARTYIVHSSKCMLLNCPVFVVMQWDFSEFTAVFTAL